MLNLEFTKPGKNLLLLTFLPRGSDQFEQYYNQKMFQRRKKGLKIMEEICYFVAETAKIEK